MSGVNPASPSRARTFHWLELAFLLLLPPLIFWLFNLRPFHQAGYLDPYFYTGYIHNPEDLLKRFGLPYYAVRFGLILPGHYLSRLLGPETGYFVFRYLLALLAGIPLYLFAKRTFHVTIAILSYTALIASPWFERTLLWDHPDASGVPYLLAGMCLLLMTRTASWKRDALAGCLVSLAVNSNVFTVAVFGIFAIVYCAAAWRHGSSIRSLFNRVACVAAGFVFVIACAYAWYWSVFGEPRNIFAPTVKMAFHLAGGGSLLARGNPAEWIPHTIYMFVPALLALCSLLAGWRVRFETSVCTLTGAFLITFLYLHEFRLGGNTVELPYYFSYALPATFLMLACLCNWLRERFAGHDALFLCAALAAALCGPATIMAGRITFGRFTLLRWAALAITVVVLVAVAKIAWRRAAVRSAALAAVILLFLSMAAAFGPSPNYSVVRHPQERDEIERDVYRVSLQLVHAVPKLKDGPGALTFWFDTTRQPMISSVQSAYLFTWSSMNQVSPLVPMPRLTGYQMYILHDPATRYVALLADSPAAIQEGLRALTEAKTGYTLLSARRFASGKFHVDYQLIEITAHPPA